MKTLKHSFFLFLKKKNSYMIDKRVNNTYFFI